MSGESAVPTPRPRRRAVRLLLGVGFCAGAMAGCATADPPPGGASDRVPPTVIAVSPEPGTTLQDLRSNVTFSFDERISERGAAAAILVSPRTGDFLVDRGGREIRVRQAGGWSPGFVYRVTLLPGVADLFGNARTEPAELVFSTGPEIVGTVLGGVVTDRMTGTPVPGAAVAAEPAGDTIAYVAIADDEGFFAIRFLPPGSYTLRGLRDGDGDWAVGAFEPSAERLLTVAEGDTLVESLAILAPDTTPAELVRAEAVDSVTVRIDFDDALDPFDAQETMVVAVRGVSVAAEPGAVTMAPHVLAAQLEEEALREASRADSAAAAAAAEAAPEPAAQGDTAADAAAERLLGAAADSAAPIAPTDSGVVTGPGRIGGGPAPGSSPSIEVPRGPDGEPLPTREWYVLLDRPLVAGQTYVVSVSGVRNVHGLDGGGGDAELQVPVPEEEPAPEGPEPTPDPEGPEGASDPEGSEPPPPGV